MLDILGLNYRLSWGWIKSLKDSPALFARSPIFSLYNPTHANFHWE